MLSRSIFENLLMLYARHFPIRRGKLRVINLFAGANTRGQITHRVAALKYGKFKMPCDITETLQRQFYFFGTYFMEEEILRCWQNAAGGAKVILDVGANAGIYSLAALAIEPDATVHAFEPTPEIAARLRETAELNGLDHLYVHEVAVLSKNGRATLRRFRGELGTNEGMNFIAEDIQEFGAERVQAVSLDQFCSDHSIAHVDLLKLDVQGHEYSVLAGARSLITAGRVGRIFMELNWSTRPEATCVATRSISLLESAGYLFSRPGKRLNWAKAGDWLRGLTDVVAYRAGT